jgi:hypothetical protein
MLADGRGELLSGFPAFVRVVELVVAFVLTLTALARNLSG